MGLHEETLQFIELYSRILFACRTRYVQDPKSELVVSEHQARILDKLGAVEPLSLTELANKMGVTLPTMSLAVDRLEYLQLIRRDRDPEDARRLHLTLTKDGVRMKEANSVLDPDRVRNVLARLSYQAREGAIRGLELMAEAVQQEMVSLHHRGQ